MIPNSTNPRPPGPRLLRRRSCVVRAVAPCRGWIPREAQPACDAVDLSAGWAFDPWVCPLRGALSGSQAWCVSADRVLLRKHGGPVPRRFAVRYGRRIFYAFFLKVHLCCVTLTTDEDRDSPLPLIM